jgi:hypothetical protein
MRRPARLLSCALLALAASCGEKPTNAATKSVAALLDEAAAAMEKDDWKQARTSLELALADGRATADERAQAWQDKVLCAARAAGDDAGIAALHKLVESKLELTPDQFGKLGTSLAQADRDQAALKVIEIATDRFGKDKAARKKLERLARLLQAKFAASGNAEGSKQLDQLGYLGGSTDEEE